MFIQTISIKFIEGAIHLLISFFEKMRRSNSFCSFNEGFN